MIKESLCIYIIIIICRCIIMLLSSHGHHPMHRRGGDSYKILHPTANTYVFAWCNAVLVYVYCNNNKNNNTPMNGMDCIADISVKKKNKSENDKGTYQLRIGNRCSWDFSSHSPNPFSVYIHIIWVPTNIITTATIHNVILLSYPFVFLGRHGRAYTRML